MELDQLKNVWLKTTRQEVKGYFISADEVQSLIKKRSNTAVAKIKKGVRNKVLMAASIGSLMILFSIYIFTTGEAVFSFLESLSNPESNFEVGIFYLVFGGVILFVSVFNAVSYKQILDIEKYETDLKTSIKGILSIIKKAIKAKIYSDTTVLPLTVLTLAIIDLFRKSGFFPNKTVLLLSILGAVGFAVFSYFLTKYGQNKRYGKQIKALEECLEELKEGD